MSIVIPTLNAGGELPGALACLMAGGVEAGLVRELVVSDGGSADGTVALAEEVGAVIVTGAPPGRGGQIARGVAAAQGDWVLILHADTQLGEGWVVAVKRLMARAASGAPPARAISACASVPRVLWPGGSRRAGPTCARACSVCPMAIRGGWFCRGHCTRMSAACPTCPLMEDVAMARALRGGRLVALDADAATSATRYEKAGWIKRGTRNLWTLTRYLMGADPEALARGGYRR